jgi:hypothetical protein
MALSTRVGRPYQVADIDLVHDPDLELYDKFFSACSVLRYSDTVVLARTLGIQVRTIRNWKAGTTFPPRKGMAHLVIMWVASGKPRKIITQAGAAMGVI